jgi:hypothetical protein
MLGSRALLIPGIVLVALGATLQAGATGAVRAIKMSVKLTGQPHELGASTRTISSQEGDVSDRPATDDPPATSRGERTGGEAGRP